MSTSQRPQEIPPIREAARTGVIPPVSSTVEASRLIGVERQHDRLGQRLTPGHAAEIQRLFIDEYEDARAGRRRGKQKREQRKGEQHLQVKGPRTSPAAPEKETRHPFGQTASQDRQADRENPDQKVGHRLGETHQRLREPRHPPGEYERDDQQNPGHGRRDRIGAPEADRHHGHGQHALSRRGETGGRRQGHQDHGQSGHENGNPSARHSLFTVFGPLSRLLFFSFFCLDSRESAISVPVLIVSVIEKARRKKVTSKKGGLSV